MCAAIMRTLIYARPHHARSASPSQLLPAPDEREQLEEGLQSSVPQGKTAAGETAKVICKAAMLKKLLASIIFNRPGAREAGK